ncbi:GyrI-like domain-containing protein [Cohnella ginsengisoli]|uniref:GyrI-like domain-containing protein n=1 Tax=Cohnella ginsengisoli TaxID=425004 RepID=A0A9X4QQX8_9BACL|nr:GyrI-like domain-containing protein [Cohnella ginsengisoli]MDG0795051.1 GyrI-like domain-containing protein [Cohnella ginsengisoli]
MSSYLVDVVERKEVHLVGLAIKESLNKVMETKIGGKLRKELERRQSEVENRTGSGMYLIQIYPQDGHWTPDVPYRHIFAYEVESFARIPGDMVSYTLPAGRFIKVVHKGAESQIGDTYDFINQTYGVRPIDIEYWNDIHTLENEDNQIDIYVPR